MTDRRYILLDTVDAAGIYWVLLFCGAGKSRILERLRDDAGADIEGIVEQLKGARPCPACAGEGQEETCLYWWMNKLGRRLARLVKRAHCTPAEYEARKRKKEE